MLPLPPQSLSPELRKALMVGRRVTGAVREIEINVGASNLSTVHAYKRHHLVILYHVRVIVSE